MAEEQNRSVSQGHLSVDQLQQELHGECFSLHLHSAREGIVLGFVILGCDGLRQEQVQLGFITYLGKAS